MIPLEVTAMAFAPTPPFGKFNIDIETGMLEIDGKLVNYRDYFDELDTAIDDHVDGLKHLRDPESDLQNLWGKKEDGFADDVYKRANPISRPAGYADDFKEDDWQIGV